MIQQLICLSSSKICFQSFHCQQLAIIISFDIGMELKTIMQTLCWVCQILLFSRAWGKKRFMLKLVEYEIYPAIKSQNINNLNFFLLNRIESNTFHVSKYLAVNKYLHFNIIRIKFVLSWVEHESSFLTCGTDSDCFA